MATTTWARLRQRVRATPAAQEVGLRRVTLRLATQTVGLLLVLLVILELVIYLVTQQTLLGSLENTLKARARAPDYGVCHTLQLSCSGQGQGGPGRGPGQQGGGPGNAPPPSGGGLVINNDPSEASVVFVNRGLQKIDAHGALGPVLLDRAGAEQALKTGTDQCCSVYAYKSQTYLVYTLPLSANGKVVGAAQTSISEHQYQSTMNTLLGALLIIAILGLIGSSGISAVLVHRALLPVRVAVQRQRDFVADAAHELRTPLAIQRTVGEVGMAEASPEELQATVAQMLGQNQHLTRLVEDLSLLARTDTGTVDLDRRPVDLSALISNTTAELSYLAADKGVTLETAAQDGVTVSGDVMRLRQLLLILLDNALKHTPVGGTVSVRLAVTGSRVRLQVSDTGPGIDPEAMPNIFDRFYRADEARSGEGSGLGLAIGKWIVDAHSGQIQAANVAPHGAIFTVTLPAARGASAAP